jgi:hypothetical protein
MTTTTKTPVDSIVIPARFVQACVGWEGGMDCMLRAVTSTGNLTTGTIAPAGCGGDEEKWYLTIWRELSVDLGYAMSAVRKCRKESEGYDSFATLAAFETWVDEVVIPALEEEYGLADWEPGDG